MDCIIAVAEKPSIADAIAKALASSPITTRSATGVRTHEFQGRYEGRQCEFRVTSVLGHCDDAVHFYATALFFARRTTPAAMPAG